MSDDFAQRRRIAVAAAITVIAVPAAFLLDRSDTDGSTETTAAAGQVAAADPPNGAAAAPDAAGSDPAVTDPMGTTPVAYLEGSAPPSEDDPATIAIPRPAGGTEGTATFKRSIGRVSACFVKGAPSEARVTVTNMDNSRSITCIAVGGVEPEDDVVLHADAFVQIADLTDAPVPVEISW